MVVYSEDDRFIVVDRTFHAENDNAATETVVSLRRGRRAILKRSYDVVQTWDSEPGEFVETNVVPLRRLTRLMPLGLERQNLP
jgi:hypothetical protein